MSKLQDSNVFENHQKVIEDAEFDITWDYNGVEILDLKKRKTLGLV